jgi:alpha-1,3-rhamnosyl/mannosyltransferase
LLEAFARLKIEARIPHRLKIIGGEADVSFAELEAQARALNVADYLDLVGQLPHSQLAAEYARASMFVYPSLSETFGYPPLEAMVMGIPVVASRATSIVEIVGEAAELVDPLSVEDIARGMHRVLIDPERANTLVRLGYQRANDFSWDVAAERTFEIVSSVLE